VRQIRNAEEERSLLFVGRGRLLVQKRNSVADLPHLPLQFVRRFAPRALAANLLAQPFPVGVQLLQRRFRFATFHVHLQNFIHFGDVLVAAARSEPSLHKVGLFPDEPDIKHGLEYQRDSPRANTLHSSTLDPRIRLALPFPENSPAF
jgi:hypothetical protein